MLATADERTNSKPQRAVNALLSYSGYVSIIKCVGNVGYSCHILELNSIINFKCAIFELYHYCIH